MAAGRDHGEYDCSMVVIALAAAWRLMCCSMSFPMVCILALSTLRYNMPSCHHRLCSELQCKEASGAESFLQPHSATDGSFSGGGNLLTNTEVNVMQNFP